MTLRVAIIGAGKWSEHHMAAWRAQPDVTVDWVVRSTEEGAREKAQRWGIPQWSTDYKAVLAREDVDIVDILLPHDLHAEATCLAVAHGKHVVLQKPIAPTLQEARRIADAGRLHNRKIMIAESWIYSTMVQKARAAIAGKQIGEPFLIRSVMDLEVKDYFAGLHWRFSLDRMGGGALMDSGTHSVSVCRYLMGEVREVTALKSCHAFPEIAPMEDTFLMLLRFESGSSGLIAVTWVAQRERPRTEFAILGTQGTIEFDTHARQFFITRGQQRCEQFELQASRGYAEQLAHFLECLRENREPITSPEDQIGSLRVILAAYRSAATGHLVQVKDLEG